jgi:uncharacterized protein YbbC (DUF1343 family)/CubicO group peptidase (beta-lactamase class C family)
VALAVLVSVGCARSGPVVPHEVPARPSAKVAEAAPPPEPAPKLPSLDPATEAAIREAVSGAIARGEVPGAVIAVVRGGEAAYLEAFGLRSVEPQKEPMTVDTVFDLASLTKAVATAPCVHVLAHEGKLALSARVARYLPSFGNGGKEGITIEQLLLHTSGLPADNAMSDYKGGRPSAFARIDALARTSEPGARFDYSDVGYIVLGELVEKVSGQGLEVFARERLFAPLGMTDTSFVPGAAQRSRAAPTERRDGEMLAGTVHDPRAAALGGVAGHAGVFSTARDLVRFAAMLLGKGPAGVLAPEALKRMIEPRKLPGGALRSLGWDVQTGFSGARGELGGYGHTGFTGTSIWIDPALDAAVIVLTSRLHPDGKGDPRRLRREVATAVARGLRSEAHAGQATPKVLTGIDVLERDGCALLRGRRVGLVTNPTGLDARGESTVDLLSHAPGVTLVALFSPEHGLRGTEDTAVGDSRDARTNLPVYSLYGKRSRPTDAQLQGLDTLVFDLADAGTRFYTFETTLGYLLEAAAAHHLRMVVLDRPNPIGGLAVEGPVLEAGSASFIGYHPVPVRHGMTLGELAQLWNHERRIGADLQVVRMEGWRRAALFDATGIAWVNPSPNLRSVDEALAYPGLGLLESTNLSVGRGTPHPFEQIGAPWIDGARLAKALGDAGLQGVRFVATAFVPSANVYAGEACQGVSLRIEDRERFEPVRTGMTIAVTLLRMYPTAWKPNAMKTQLGHAATLASLVRGDSVESIVVSWEKDRAAFLAIRKKYLLYSE